jgi:hypothetical protein
MLGGHPVILAGFDCYGGVPRSVNQHKDYVPHVKCDVRVASGPLVGVWPAYDALEQRTAYVPPDVFGEVATAPHGVKVRVMKPVAIRGREWPVGTVLHVPRQEVWRQIKHRSLAEVSP